MRERSDRADLSLVGVGLYTPRQAQNLLGVSAGKLSRWLRGHQANGRRHEPLWRSEVQLGDGHAYLSFLDLVQARLAAALMGTGLSAIRVRSAIAAAGTILGTSHPFASARFRTDGKTILLQTLMPGEDDRLMDLFRNGQYVMREIIEPSLKDVDFAADLAVRWWPDGRGAGIVLDPTRQFGRPIDDRTGVPTDILVRSVAAEGSVEAAARAYQVAPAVVRRSVAFEHRRPHASRLAA